MTSAMAAINNAPSSRGSSASGRATISRHLAERSMRMTVAVGPGPTESHSARRCIAVPYQFEELRSAVIQIARAYRMPFRPHIAATDEETHEGDKAWNRKTGQAPGDRFAAAAAFAASVGAVSLGAQAGVSPVAGAANPAIKSLADAHLGCSGVDGEGYWQVSAAGGVFTNGAAVFYGSEGGATLNKPIVGMAPSVDGRGYWLVASDGGVFSFGDAPFKGSTGAIHLNAPIVGHGADAGRPGLLAGGLRRRRLLLR